MSETVRTKTVCEGMGCLAVFGRVFLTDEAGWQ